MTSDERNHRIGVVSPNRRLRDEHESLSCGYFMFLGSRSVYSRRYDDVLFFIGAEATLLCVRVIVRTPERVAAR